jgi:hypothetical protein
MRLCVAQHLLSVSDWSLPSCFHSSIVFGFSTIMSTDVLNEPFFMTLFHDEYQYDSSIGNTNLCRSVYRIAVDVFSSL